MRRAFLRLIAGVAASALALPVLAQQGETVKIAWIDPLSGLMAGLGNNQLKSFQFFAEKFSASNTAGVKFEIVPYDNKLSPQETTAALRSAIDQGIRYVVQGNGSGPALAIIDALNKHNERNPGKEVLYLNYAAVDPDLTNSKCSYWQYRFDADTSMKMKALTSFIAEQKDIKKIYLINQNYAHGIQVAKYAKDDLKATRPDIEIVGEDLHPLAQVRDFAPYVAKIKQSGADSVITGNWGSDLALLVKAANDAGLNVKFFTYYAFTTGTPTALGGGAAGKVYTVFPGNTGMTGPMHDMMVEYKQRFNDDLFMYTGYSALAALSTAIAKAKTTAVLPVAKTLEGMKFENYNGPVEIRAKDHQLQQPLDISMWAKAPDGTNITSENTGYWFQGVQAFDAATVSTPTICEMKRPAG